MAIQPRFVMLCGLCALAPILASCGASDEGSSEPLNGLRASANLTAGEQEKWRSSGSEVGMMRVSVTAATHDAWKKLGGEFEHAATNYPLEPLYFRVGGGEANNAEIPAFNFGPERGAREANHGWKLGVLNVVPPPSVPFGLCLAETDVADSDFVDLGRFENLRALDLRNCRQLTDEGMRHVTEVSNLEALAVGGVKLTDAGIGHLAHLPRLRILDLRATGLTDAGLQSLQGLKQLEFLDLGLTKITDGGLAQLAAFPKLEALSMLPFGPSEAAVDALSQLSNLKMLRIAVLSTTAKQALQQAIPGLRIVP